MHRRGTIRTAPRSPATACRLPALFESVRACLEPGGLFLYCDHDVEAGSSKNPELYLTREQQPEALAAAGFADVRLLLDGGGMALLSARCP
ncbi:hypothetical protein SAMN06265365_1254 [Tistlia consotensis]|uniref:O-methyltransferase n=1 Tax=Tistlia consotensis USBA 355 TaxID=560819 RepID=A0A1Y6CPE9_9PROT|nr:hypothetical protein [Tistlia consotensis]SMF68644.1 hypothetical protein SAMN05428998_1284 [Tistlia consotensis USBA 355]SNS01149.1 hypothetical protein SAMN06265365_1254 [Tistlia consotensis]